MIALATPTGIVVADGFAPAVRDAAEAAWERTYTFLDKHRPRGLTADRSEAVNQPYDADALSGRG